jgi:hypothetical protein
MKALPLLLLCVAASPLVADVVEADVVVYGGTASGVSAACTAMRLGKGAVIAE